MKQGRGRRRNYSRGKEKFPYHEVLFEITSRSKGNSSERAKGVKKATGGNRRGGSHSPLGRV